MTLSNEPRANSIAALSVASPDGGQAVRVEEMRQHGTQSTDWKPFPDPTKGDFIVAPFGPGCYELRDTASGKLVLFGSAGHVAYRMSSLHPSGAALGTAQTRRDKTRRQGTRRARSRALRLEASWLSLPHSSWECWRQLLWADGYGLTGSLYARDGAAGSTHRHRRLWARGGIREIEGVPPGG
jgi:hypothetical protein